MTNQANWVNFKMTYTLVQLPHTDKDGQVGLKSKFYCFPIVINESKTFIVGRHASSDFNIESPDLPHFLSRKHATLKIVNGELFVKDLSSTNGTFVNNIMIPPHTETHLQRGDCVAFGYKGDTKPKPGNHVENICTPIKFKIHLTQYKTIPKKPEEETRNLNSKVSYNVVSSTNEDASSNKAQGQELQTNRSRKNSSTNPADNEDYSAQPTKSTVNEFIESQSNERSVFEEANILEKRKISEESSTARRPCKKLCKSPSPHNIQSNVVDSSTCTSDKSASRTGRSISKTPSSSKPSAPLPNNKNSKNSSAVPKLRKLKSPKRGKGQPGPLPSAPEQPPSMPLELCAAKEMRGCVFQGKKEIDVDVAVICWVQCDSCNQWYHTVCVGCDYDIVKNPDSQFHCGNC